MQTEAAIQPFLQESAQSGDLSTALQPGHCLCLQPGRATEEYPSPVIFFVRYVRSSSLPAEGGQRGGEDVSDQFTCKYYYASAPKRIKRKQLP